MVTSHTNSIVVYNSTIVYAGKHDDALTLLAQASYSAQYCLARTSSTASVCHQSRLNAVPFLARRCTAFVISSETHFPILVGDSRHYWVAMREIDGVNRLPGVYSA